MKNEYGEEALWRRHNKYLSSRKFFFFHFFIFHLNFFFNETPDLKRDILKYGMK